MFKEIVTTCGGCLLYFNNKQEAMKYQQSLSSVTKVTENGVHREH
jgi:hypothetical protein